MFSVRFSRSSKNLFQIVLFYPTNGLPGIFPQIISPSLSLYLTQSLFNRTPWCSAEMFSNSEILQQYDTRTGTHFNLLDPLVITKNPLSSYFHWSFTTTSLASWSTPIQRFCYSESTVSRTLLSDGMTIDGVNPYTACTDMLSFPTPSFSIVVF